MQRYKLIREVGDGSFGNVWRAKNKQTGEVVAIKKMKKKYYSWEECINLREVKSLRKMNHPNVIKLKEVIREYDILHFVFEYMECNLYQLMKDGGRPFSEVEVRNWCFQVFQGLFHMHNCGYFHRDLKPENILFSNDLIKIADFGLAREINSAPPFTEYVSTRWYRAPEVLLQSPTYTSAVDMWAMGAIMAELFTLRPLFPGLSEADEIYKICSVIGTPTEHSWDQGLVLARAVNYQFPQLPGVNLSTLMPTVSEVAVSLIRSLCSWDPLKRPTVAEVLQHPFFKNYYYVPPSVCTRENFVRVSPSTENRGYLGQRYARKPYGQRTLPNTKIISPELHVAFTGGLQCKNEMEGEDLKTDKKSTQNSVKHPTYRPPVKNSPSNIYSRRNNHGMMEATEKLLNMNLSGGRQATRPIPPPMKAGGWHSGSDMFLGRPQGIQPGRTYPRKIMG